MFQSLPYSITNLFKVDMILIYKLTLWLVKNTIFDLQRECVFMKVGMSLMVVINFCGKKKKAWQTMMTGLSGS